MILYAGMFMRAKIAPLRTYNIPTPVIGGVIFALLNWALREYIHFGFDMTLSNYFMIAFFTTIGLSASLQMLKQGGRQVFIFLIAASVLIVCQDAVAIVVSKFVGIHPALGMLAGSITMSGGHGTGAAYATVFEKQFGLTGCMELAMAAATFGLVMGSVIGGPVARRLIQKNGLAPDKDAAGSESGEVTVREDGQITTDVVMRTLMQIAFAMSLGGVFYKWLADAGVQIPSYLCALFVGIAVRNVSDFTGAYKVHLRLCDMVGSVSLSLFLAMSLMSLKLWQLADLAGAMSAILISQVALLLLFAYFITFRVMGRDYTAAVITGGHCGFGLGATANAIANMDAIVTNYGPAPKAFFIVSIVGAFFIDIVNAIVIQAFVSFL